MASLTFVSPDGSKQVVDARPGVSVMQAAINEGIDGIVAECGGNAMCATCHVYVDPAWEAKVPAIKQDEEDMLDSTASERKPNSRLSCQIDMSPELDGLVVHLPESQI
ncbi:MAG: 2Fe-2S iron-sulfur cluster-binding protein [Janthinobacterium lividum]